jgi:hypothetical protein
MIIVGITGRIGQGKSTAGKILAAQYPKATVLPFAKAVKDSAITLGWDGKKDDKGRRLLQLLGTEIGRQCIDENIWVNKWLSVVHMADDDILIADDVRFPNEIKAIRELNGTVLNIYNRHKKQSDADTHDSERQQLDWDYRISNKSGMKDLTLNIQAFTRYLHLEYSSKVDE